MLELKRLWNRLHQRRGLLLSAALLAIILAVSACVWQAPPQAWPRLAIHTAATPQMVEQLARADGPAWDHGAGQNCKECHNNEASPTEADWRSIPAGAGPVPPQESEGEGPQARLDYFTAQRAYPLKTLPQGARLKAFAQAMAMARPQTAAAAWTSARRLSCRLTSACGR